MFNCIVIPIIICIFALNEFLMYVVMKKLIGLIFCAVLMMGVSCRSKKNLAEIPSGGDIVATSEPEMIPNMDLVKNTQPAQSVAQPEPEPVKEVPVEVEQEPVVEEKAIVTRSEAFTVPEGQDTQVMNRNFHVVVGSFRNKSNADGLFATLRSEGYSPAIVVNEQGMYRVLIVSCDNYQEARAQLSSIRSRFADAWVLVQKKN